MNVAGHLPREFALFLCNFRDDGDGRDADGTHRMCAGAYARRQRSPCGGCEAEQDRPRLRDELLRQKRGPLRMDERAHRVRELKVNLLLEDR